MSSWEDELLQDAADDARTVAYVRQQLPERLQTTFTDDVLYYFLDVIAEYYTQSGLMDNLDDDYVDIEIDAVAAYVKAKAEQERMGSFNADDIALVVEAELDFSESEGA